MPITINGTGTITGISAGGLPDAIITTSEVVDLNITPEKLSQKLTSGTAVASTSGTSIDFTGLPAWIKKITVMFIGVSGSGISVPTVRLGITSGIEATGYLGSCQNGTSATLFTTGFEYAGNLQTAARVYHGAMTITLQNSSTNTWAATSIVGLSDGGSVGIMGGSKSTAGVVTQLRITFVNGTDTFDAGSINILYE
jgi:hypothetical protein